MVRVVRWMATYFLVAVNMSVLRYYKWKQQFKTADDCVDETNNSSSGTYIYWVNKIFLGYMNDCCIHCYSAEKNAIIIEEYIENLEFVNRCMYIVHAASERTHSYATVGVYHMKAKCQIVFTLIAPFTYSLNWCGEVATLCSVIHCYFTREIPHSSHGFIRSGRLRCKWNHQL